MTAAKPRPPPAPGETRTYPVLPLRDVPVSRMDEVLARSLTRKPESIEWDETTTTAPAVPEEAPVDEEASILAAH